jgi:hypothetical protein
VSSYVRRLPSLSARLFWFVLFVVVGIIRTVWLLVIPFFIVGIIAALLGIPFSWQWMVPILVVFGVALFILLWNRHPYRNPHRNS